MLLLLAHGPLGVAAGEPLSINGIIFDPVAGEPSIPASLRAPEVAGRATYLVQFRGPIEEGWKESLVSSGASLHGYIPENGFIVRMDRATADAVRGRVEAAYVGLYHTAYRMDPQIGRIVYRSPERAGDPRLTLRVRVAEDRAEAQAAAERIPGLAMLEAIDDPFQPGFVVRIDPARVVDLAALPEVLWVEERPETFVLNNVTRWVVQTNVTGSTPIWDQGILGQGQVVCEMDTGLDYNSCWFRDANNAPPGPSHRKVIDYREWGGNQYDGCDDGHGTHVAGTVVGDQSFVNPGNTSYNGMAYKAKIMIQDVGSDGWLACFFGLLSVPTSLSSPFSDAFTKGARVHTNSWGSTNNAYDSYCVDVDNFMWNHKDFLVVFANGNSGPSGSTVSSPATAKNCVSVGATKQSPNQDAIASYSSRGPAYDSRYKPTVCAPGGESPTYINSADNNTGDPPSPTCNAQGNPFQGTSMATPAVAGCALLVRDYFAQGFYPLGAAGGDALVPSAALVKAVLVNGAKDMATADQPNNNEGWGRVLLEDVLYFAGQTRELRLEDEQAGLATGEEMVFTYDVDSSAEPFETVLVWTDYPASQNANPALVNNLDLTVTAPNGDVFRGNVYSGGQSATGGSADARNVEECVRRTSPVVGQWQIRVRAANVPQGVRQPFALVTTGSFGNWPEDPAAIGPAGPFERNRLEVTSANPFAERATLRFQTAEDGPARLTVRDARGRIVSVLADRVFSAGTHTCEWSPAEGANGVYFATLATSSGSITRKLIHVR